MSFQENKENNPRKYINVGAYNDYYNFAQEYLKPTMDIDELLDMACGLTVESGISSHELSKFLATADYLLTLLNNYTLEEQHMIVDYALKLYKEAPDYGDWDITDEEAAKEELEEMKRIFGE